LFVNRFIKSANRDRQKLDRADRIDETDKA